MSEREIANEKPVLSGKLSKIRTRKAYQAKGHFGSLNALVCLLGTQEYNAIVNIFQGLMISTHSSSTILTAVPHACDSCMSHLLLELEYSIHQCLRCRWASRNINIDRNNPITSSYNRVTVMIVAAAIRTTSHADDPAWIRHLIVNLSKGWCHFVSQCTSHNHHI